LLLSSISYSNIKATVDPTDIGIGARPTGMGKAFTAVAGDVNNIFVNPAGLYSLKAVELTSMYTNLLGDINYSLLGVSYPTSAGTFGIGYVGIQTGDVIVTGLDSSGRPVDIGSRIGYANNVLILSYGNTLERWARLWRPLNDMTMGLNVKLFSESFRGTGGQSAIGTDLDLGFTYKPRPYLTFGLLGKNFLHYESPIGGTLSWTNGTRESIPALLKLGAAMKFFGNDAPKQFRGQDILGSIDLDLNPNGSYPSLLHMGVEWLPVQFLAIRAGLEQSYGGAGVNPATNNFTAGIGLKARNLSFDYAYRKDNVLSENSNHYISVSYAGPDISSKKGPLVSISSPEDKLILRSDHVVLSGTAAPSVNRIEVNKAVVPFDKNSKAFSSNIPLSKTGKNLLVIEAYDKNGKLLGANTRRILRLASFKDVGENYWARQQVEYCATAGLVTGYPDGSFMPDKTLSRAELSTLMVKSKGLSAPSASKSGAFPDVASNNWAAGFISTANENGYILGYPDGTFRPSKTITRAEGISVIARFDGLSGIAPKEKPYSDLGTDHWAAGSVSAAKEKGLLNFVSFDTLLPDQGLTRAEAVDMLGKTGPGKEKIDWLLNWNKGFDTTAIAAIKTIEKTSAEVNIKAIPDVPSGYWAKPAVDYVIGARILSLYPDGLFRPEKPINRADLAVMLVKSKFSGFPPEGTKELSFTDVPPGHWAKRMIGVAAGQDLMKGYPDNTFRPNNNISLLDAVYAFGRLGRLAEARPSGNVYSNIPEDHFAAGRIKAAKDKGLLEFVRSKDFQVNAPVSRAQAAWMLYKLKN